MTSWPTSVSAWAGDPSGVMFLRQIEQFFLEHLITGQLLSLIFAYPWIHVGQKVTVVHGFTQNGKFWSFVHISYFRHLFFQVGQVISLLYTSLTFHRVVQIANFTTFFWIRWVDTIRTVRSCCWWCWCSKEKQTKPFVKISSNYNRAIIIFSLSTLHFVHISIRFHGL